MTRASGISWVRTGHRVSRGLSRLAELHALARELCPDGFPAEETRELKALYAHVPLGLVDDLADELAQCLDLPRTVFSRDRFSVHGCGPVGMHDDFFRFPYVYFVVVVAHCGRLGLVDEHSVAIRHQPGEIILLDPRRKHGLVREGMRAEDHVYDSSHASVTDSECQFMFLDFDVRRPDLRARFRRGGG